MKWEEKKLQTIVSDSNNIFLLFKKILDIYIYICIIVFNLFT
jgi:hypothetical protein